MPHYSSFDQLDIYKLARQQCKDVWFIIQNTSLKTDFKLRDQISGSSGSVMDNIAEGFGRDGNREFLSFLSYSKGSCCETKAQLQRAFDRNHIDEELFKDLEKKSENIIEQISKFSNFLRVTDRKGLKFDPINNKNK